MYDLTKVYKTKAMAVNAIRMTANNKGWKVLSTEEAATHVWPQAEGFVVNNTTLNLALGFITEEAAKLEQRVPEGSVTSGAALEAANAALAEQAPKTKADAMAEKVRAELYGKDGKGSQADAVKNSAKLLQAPSKLEESKKAAKANKAPKGTGKDGTSATRCLVVNGARRPLRGKTLLVWETTELLHTQLDRVPSMKEVHEALCKQEPGFNKTTTGIQYYACRTYNGWGNDKK